MSAGRMRLAWGLGVPLALYLTALFAAYGLQRSMLFPAPRPPRTPWLDGATLVTLQRGELHTVGLYAPAPAGAPTVVYFHGNGEQLADVVPVIAALRGRGIGVFAVEYPGYGLATGQPSEASLFDAARAALAWLRNHGHVEVARTVLFGQSLGTGVAVTMAAEGLAARAVLVSPYTSISEVAQAAIPWLPGRWLVRDRFDSLSRARFVHIPVLVLHGDRDAVVPFAQGQRLATALHARFVRRHDRGHNDLWNVTEPGEQNLVDLVADHARGE